MLLLALTWTGISGGLHQIPQSQSSGQKVQSVLQLAYGVLGLSCVLTTFWGRRWGPLIQIGWALSVALAAGFASVVWGGTTMGIGLLSGGAALLIALAMLWLLRVGARSLTSDEGEDLQGESLEASLTVKDLDTSVAWYCDMLGFAVDRKHERAGKVIAVSLHAGAVRILLGQDDGAKGLDRVKGEGMSLQITTRQSADAIAARIKEHGVLLDTEPVDMPWGVRIFRLRDPDGFRLTISSTHAAKPA